jgi:hypothetical protein
MAPFFLTSTTPEFDSDADPEADPAFDFDTDPELALRTAMDPDQRSQNEMMIQIPKMSWSTTLLIHKNDNRKSQTTCGRSTLPVCNVSVPVRYDNN